MDTALFLTLFLFAVQTAAGVAPMRWPNHTWLAGLIFYVSGFFAIACLVWWSFSNWDWLMPALQPPQIIALGLAIALGGLFWQWRRQPPPDPQIAVLQSQVGTLREQLAAIHRPTTSAAAPTSTSNSLSPREAQKLTEALEDIGRWGEATIWPTINNIEMWAVNWRGVIANNNGVQLFTGLRDSLKTEVWEKIDNLLSKYSKYDGTLQSALALDDPLAKNELAQSLQECIDAIGKLPPNPSVLMTDLLEPHFKKLIKQSGLAFQWEVESKRRTREMLENLKKNGVAEYAKK